MIKGDTLNKTNNKELLGTLAKVAVPIAAQSLIGSSLNLVDNLMVGSLGELSLNAVGVSVQIYFVYWMLLYGFCSGSATFVSQFFGVRDIKNIRKTVGFTLIVSMGVGALFFLAALIFPQYILKVFTRFPDVIDTGALYVRIGAPCFLFVAITQPFTIALRATQQTKLPLIASAIGLGINTVLNYILIFGHFGAPAMGVSGAALATVISRLIEMLIILYIVFGRKNTISGSIKEFCGFEKTLAMRIVKNALPTTINETMWGLGTSMYIAAFARIGITEGAAIQACNTINNLFTMAAFSIGDAILILVGQKLGEGKINTAYEMSKKLVLIGVITGLVLGGALIVLGDSLLQLFDFTPIGEEYASKILFVYGATFVVSLYNGIHVTGTLRCGGDTRFAMFTETGTVWLIGVPLAFITSLYLHWPIYFAVLAVKGEEFVKAIILTKRYFSKKWLNNVIHDIEAKK